MNTRKPIHIKSSLEDECSDNSSQRTRPIKRSTLFSDLESSEIEEIDSDKIGSGSKDAGGTQSPEPQLSTKADLLFKDIPLTESKFTSQNIIIQSKTKIVEKKEDIVIEEAKPKIEIPMASFKAWLQNMENLEEKIQANCIHLSNLPGKINENILFELFSKGNFVSLYSLIVGKIKRIKLFRAQNRDIENSAYLKSLGFDSKSEKPHKV
jgi:hypothetical protein